jgi:hypothetical protein
LAIAGGIALSILPARLSGGSKPVFLALSMTRRDFGASLDRQDVRPWQQVELRRTMKLVNCIDGRWRMSTMTRDASVMTASEVRSSLEPPTTTATPRGWSTRVSALAGLVFFALMLVHAGLRNGAPAASDSGQEIYDHVVENAGRYQLSAVALGLAMAAVLVWLPAPFGALRRAEGGSTGAAMVAVAGGVLAAAGAVMMALIEGTLATTIEDIGPAGARTWWTLFLTGVGPTLVGLLVLIGATATVSVRTHLFGRWLTIASVVLAVASLVGAFTIGYATVGIQVTAAIALLLDGVWIMVVSLKLWRHPALAAP